MNGSDQEARSQELSERLGIPVVYRNGWIVLRTEAAPACDHELTQWLLDQVDLEDAGLEPPPFHLDGETNKQCRDGRSGGSSHS
jgi:hypothetical protein